MLPIDNPLGEEGRSCAVSLEEEDAAYSPSDEGLGSGEEVLHMEELISGVETAQRDKEIFLAMKKGTETLKEIRQEVPAGILKPSRLRSAQEEESRRGVLTLSCSRISEMLAGNFDKEEEEAMNRELDLMMGEAGVPAVKWLLFQLPPHLPSPLSLHN
eukprot:764410-Hanusia_phi.AAC.3